MNEQQPGTVNSYDLLDLPDSDDFRDTYQSQPVLQYVDPITRTVPIASSGKPGTVCFLLPQLSVGVTTQLLQVLPEAPNNVRRRAQLLATNPVWLSRDPVGTLYQVNGAATTFMYNGFGLAVNRLFNYESSAPLYAGGQLSPAILLSIWIENEEV